MSEVDTSRPGGVEEMAAERVITIPPEKLGLYFAATDIIGAEIDTQYVAASAVKSGPEDDTAAVVERAEQLQSINDYLQSHQDLPMLNVSPTGLHLAITTGTGSLNFSDAEAYTTTLGVSGRVSTNRFYSSFFLNGSSQKTLFQGEEFLTGTKNGNFGITSLPDEVITSENIEQFGAAASVYEGKEVLVLGEDAVANFVVDMFRQESKAGEYTHSLGMLAVAGFKQLGRVPTDGEVGYVENLAPALLAQLLLQGHSMERHYNDSIAKMIHRLPAIDLENTNRGRVANGIKNIFRYEDGGGLRTFAWLSGKQGGSFEAHADAMVDSLFDNILAVTPAKKKRRSSRG